MKISAVYIDANGMEYPIKVGGCKFSNTEELMIRLNLKGVFWEDTIRVRIIDNCAELDKGDPVVDEDDVNYANYNTDGTLVLSGYGG